MAVDNSQYCSNCNISFPSKMRHVFHLQFHQKGVVVERRCDLCLAEFDDETSLFNHIRYQHAPDTEKELLLRDCDESLISDSELRRIEDLSQKHNDIEECDSMDANNETVNEHVDGELYTCKLCGDQFSDLANFKVHFRNHLIQESYSLTQICHQCVRCHQVFPSEHLVTKHSSEVHNKQGLTVKREVSLLFRCEYCDGCFGELDELNTHRKRDHSDPSNSNAYVCQVCDSAFPTYPQLITHKLSHKSNNENLLLVSEVETPIVCDDFSVPKYFACEVCGKKCLHYTFLNMHRKISHSHNNDKKNYNACKSSSLKINLQDKKSDRDAVKEWERKERRERKMRCPICKRHYTNEETLEAHMRIKHCSGTPTAKPYMCETCGKTFAFKSVWQAHCDAHNGMKNYACSECDKRFTHRAGLMKHMRLHSTDRPYICDFCGKKFRDRTERRNHMRAHTGERPFMCEVCGRAFHTRAVLLDHSRIHRNERPYPCDVCGLAFRRSFALKSHKLIHTGQKPFECTDCGRTFRLKQTLATHQKKEHQGNNTLDNQSPAIFILEEAEYETVDDEDVQSNLDDKSDQTFVPVT